MTANKIASKFIVAAVCNHELDLVSLGQEFEIAHSKASTLARTRTLHIHDLVYDGWHTIQRPLAAGFNHQLISRSKQTLHQRNQLELLQQRLAAGKLDQLHRSELLDLSNDFIF